MTSRSFKLTPERLVAGHSALSWRYKPHGMIICLLFYLVAMFEALASPAADIPERKECIKGCVLTNEVMLGLPEA